MATFEINVERWYRARHTAVVTVEAEDEASAVILVEAQLEAGDVPESYEDSANLEGYDDAGGWECADVEETDDD